MVIQQLFFAKYNKQNVKLVALHVPLFNVVYLLEKRSVSKQKLHVKSQHNEMSFADDVLTIGLNQDDCYFPS